MAGLGSGDSAVQQLARGGSLRRRRRGDPREAALVPVEGLRDLGVHSGDRDMDPVHVRAPFRAAGVENPDVGAELSGLSAGFFHLGHMRRGIHVRRHRFSARGARHGVLRRRRRARGGADGPVERVRAVSGGAV